MPLPTPTRTAKAFEWLLGRGLMTDQLQMTLLSNIDGHRNVVELESFALAMGLQPDALERLRHQGLIELQS